MPSGRCGKNVTWEFTTNTLTISGFGEMDNYSQSNGESSSPWNPYRKSIQKVIIGDGVTKIGGYAFYCCSVLIGIKIPDSVTEIGTWAFCGCGALTEIKLPNGVAIIGECTFLSCWALAEMKIPDGVTIIGSHAFDTCWSLTEIEIPDSVTVIGNYVFIGCDGLKKIHYPAGRGFEENLSQGNYARLIPYDTPTPQPVSKPQPVVEQLRWKVEGKTLTVGGVREIQCYSYADSPWIDSFNVIQKIIIEEGVERIAANAFIECTRLEQVIIPASVKTIGDCAFTVCYCGERFVNNCRNVLWSLDDGVLTIKKNPDAKSEKNFETGYAKWQVVEKNIRSVTIERGVVPGKQFFDWLNSLNAEVPVTF